MSEIPVKTLSRKPFVIMLQDDAGEITPVQLDPALVTSDNALIVLDEYNDTCWVWIGKNVNMPTRMHALRMARQFQKSGHQVGVTTIGMSTSRLVELMERNADDPDVAAQIEEFKKMLNIPWKFEDKVLAYDETRVGKWVTAPVRLRESGAEHVSVEPAPSAPVTHVEPRPVSPRIEETRPTQPIAPTARAAPTPSAPSIGDLSEKKAAFLLYSIVKHADLVYTERFEREGKSGVKIEAPGLLILEAILDGNELRIDPPHFGDSEAAQRIKSEYESWTKNL